MSLKFKLPVALIMGLALSTGASAQSTTSSPYASDIPAVEWHFGGSGDEPVTFNLHRKEGYQEIIQGGNEPTSYSGQPEPAPKADKDK